MKKASELFKVCPRCDGEGKIKYMGDKPSPYDLSVSDDTWRKKINEAPLVACAKCEGLGFVNKESE